MKHRKYTLGQLILAIDKNAVALGVVADMNILSAYGMMGPKERAVRKYKPIKGKLKRIL